MAYRKRSFKRTLKRGYKRVARGVASVARLARQVYTIRRALNPERKFLEYTNATITPTAGASWYNVMNYVAGGTQKDQRTGNSIKMTSFQIRMLAERNGGLAGIGAPNFLRMIVYIDKEPAVGGATLTQLLKSDAVQSMKDYETQMTRRFQVLYDRTYKYSASENAIIVNRWIKLNHHVRFTDQTSTSLSEGALYVALLVDNNTGTDQNIRLQTRLLYVDN